MVHVADTTELVARIPLFRALGDEDLNHLAERAQRRSVATKTVVVRQGDRGASVYAVLSGRLKVQTTRDPEVILLDVLGPGEVFGEIALVTGGIRRASVVALEPCELLIIDQRDLRHLLGRQPDLALHLLQSLASRILGLDKLVEDFHTLRLGPRLASRVCTLAEEHGVQDRTALVIDLNLSQRDWADLIGANREAVNRHFRVWKKRGWIRIQGKYMLVDDLDALRSLGDLAGLVSTG